MIPLMLGISLVFHLFITAECVARSICMVIDLTDIGYLDIFRLKIACSMLGCTKTLVTLDI